MENLNLTAQEIEEINAIIERVKQTGAYKNYLEGVRVMSKRADQLPGEGDAFSKIGAALQKDNPPAFLRPLLRGQEKIGNTLRSELKQKRMQRLLKNEEFNQFLYGKLYIETQKATTQQEDEMSNTEQNQTENQNTELFQRPDYDAAFYESEQFKKLGLDKDLTAEELKKLTEEYEKWREGQKQEDQNEGENENADAENAGEGNGENENAEAENAENANEGADGLEEENTGEPLAEENNDEQNSAAEETSTALEISSEDENDSRTNEQAEPEWVERYNATLLRWGEENNDEWTRDNEEDENGTRPVGLKGKFKSGVKLHYTAEDKVSVKAPEGQQISAEHFAAVIALAKENGQDIKLGQTMSPEFKSALIEACAKGGIEMQGLSEEDKRLYENFAPKAEERAEERTEENNDRPQTRAAVVKDTDEHGNPLYKVNPRIVEGWLSMYRNKATDSKTFDKEIATFEKQLAGGAYQVTGEEKARAQLLMMKYVQAMGKGDKEQAEQCVTALQRYGADTIVRNPEPDGKDVITTKPYGERSDEEKAKIDAATEKLLPKKAQEYDPAVMRAIMNARGQSRE